MSSPTVTPTLVCGPSRRPPAVPRTTGPSYLSALRHRITHPMIDPVDPEHNSCEIDEHDGNGESAQQCDRLRHAHAPLRWYARRDSNPRIWLRRPALYPLSYGRVVLSVPQPGLHPQRPGRAGPWVQTHVYHWCVATPRRDHPAGRVATAQGRRGFQSTASSECRNLTRTRSDRSIGPRQANMLPSGSALLEQPGHVAHPLGRREVRQEGQRHETATSTIGLVSSESIRPMPNTTMRSGR